MISRFRFGGRRQAIVLVTVAAIALGACGSSSETQDVGIPPQDAEAVAQGAALYQANCASCHGVDLRGTDTGPSHLSAVYEPNHHGDGAFLFAVLRGVQAHHWPFGDMEPVAGLTTDDVNAIVAFVRDQQRIHGFEPYPP